MLDRVDQRSKDLKYSEAQCARENAILYSGRVHCQIVGLKKFTAPKIRMTEDSAMAVAASKILDLCSKRAQLPA